MSKTRDAKTQISYAEYFTSIFDNSRLTVAPWIASAAIVGEIAAASDAIRSVWVANARDFAIPNLSGECSKALERLGQLGWTVPMRLTLHDVTELIQKPVGQIDGFFVDYYTADNFAELRLVRSELEKRPGLSQWKALVIECFDSFESAKYLITIPALISVVEGVVASAGKSLHKRRVDLRKICSQKISRKGTVTDSMWRSLEVFIDNLFQDAPFGQSRPSFINRNWILHGRDSATWEAADSLRLFNALQTVDSLLE